MDKKVGVATRIKGIAFKLIVITLLLWVAISVIFAFKLRNSDTSQDFSSKELVMKGTDIDGIEGYSSKEVVGDLTIFKFDSEEETKNAYTKGSVLYGSENIDVNNYLSTYLDEEEVEAVTRVTSEDTELKKYLDAEYEKGNYSDVTVAVIDTGLNLGVDYKKINQGIFQRNELEHPLFYYRVI